MSRKQQSPNPVLSYSEMYSKMSKAVKEAAEANRELKVLKVQTNALIEENCKFNKEIGRLNKSLTKTKLLACGIPTASLLCLLLFTLFN